jgi:3-deoxy-D-manno-octulosonate 8-phosphate phosphatase (KDO 8-P phosphatase)
MVNVLPPEKLRLRALRIRLLLTDVDGVLTDAGVYYSERGEELRRFSLRDGMGVELLRASGIETAFLSREDSGIVRARAKKLAVRTYLGVMDKLAHLPEILAQSGLERGEVAFIGDDVNDLPLLREIAEQGLAGAPADAIDAVRRAVHYVSGLPGGHGAFRDFADALLRWRTTPT